MTESEYLTWISVEVRKPGWSYEHPPWPDGLMFGTCFNDDCEGVQVMETEEVGIWRRRIHDDGTHGLQGLCRPCTQRLIPLDGLRHNDGSNPPSASAGGSGPPATGPANAGLVQPGGLRLNDGLADHSEAETTNND